jgi:hypothetical protein
MEKGPIRPTLPATFKMKRGGTIKVLLEVGYEPADRSVGIMQESYYPDGSAWTETNKGYRNMDWVFDHSIDDPIIDIPEPYDFY